ncbi:MAG: winged helix-turn-helix domain-containing protein [Myxococcota bacterium]
MGTSLARAATPPQRTLALRLVKLDRIRTAKGYVDLRRRVVVGVNDEVALTELETQLLVYLAERAGQTVSRDELIAQIWGGHASNRAVDHVVRRLRAKLDDGSAGLLRTAYGVGYRFEPAESPVSGAPEAVAESPRRWLVLPSCDVDLDRGEVLRGGDVQALTALESRLLNYLADRSEDFVSREELLVEVWGYRATLRTRAAERTIQRLRVKLGHSDAEPAIEGKRGAGYRLCRRRGNVTGRLGPLFGRAKEEAALIEHLEQGRRLVTITGPPGVGKTSLALRIAERLGPRWLGGIWVVDLTSAHREADVVEAIGRVLGQPRSSSSQLASALAGVGRHGRVLMVLDNFEHLVDDCASAIGDWLTAASELTLLLTSRQPLRLRAESVFKVAPLAPTDGVAMLQALAPDAGPPEVLHPLIERLDGLPLAIRLAARPLEVLSVAQLVERLDREFLGTLSDGPQDAGSRERTMTGAIEVSWKLLTDVDREHLVQLSWFRGGFTLDTLPEVLGATGPSESVVARLLRRSLITRSAEGQRFRLYEAVWAYVTLVAPASPAVRPFVQGFATLSAHYVGLLWGPEPTLAFRFIEQEFPNLVRAVELALTLRFPEVLNAASTIAVALLEIRLAGGMAGLGPNDPVLDQARALLAGTLSDDARHTLRWAMVVVLSEVGKTDEAQMMLDAIRLTTPEPDPDEQARIDNWEIRHLWARDVSRLRDRTDRARANAWRAGPRNRASLLITHVYAALHVPRPGEVATSLEPDALAALAAAREMGSSLSECECLIMLGGLYQRTGRRDEALAAFRGAAERVLTSPNWILATCWTKLGAVHLGAGQLERAHHYLQQVRQFDERYGPSAPLSLIATSYRRLLAKLVAERGDFDQARYWADRDVAALRALERSNLLAATLMTRAMIGHLDGRLAEASTDIDEALTVMSPEPRPYRERVFRILHAWLNSERGAIEEAERTWAWLKDFPDEPLEPAMASLQGFAELAHALALGSLETKEVRTRADQLLKDAPTAWEMRVAHRLVTRRLLR